MLSINLTGKTAIVTGVSSGIGAGIAKMLAKAGCNIAGCSRKIKTDKKITSFINSIENYGQKAFYKKTDVTSKEQIINFVDNTYKEFGKIDIVVSNAGTNIFKGAIKCSDEEWEYNHKLNLSSHWHLAKASHKFLKEKKEGVFIIITSNHAYSSIPGCFPYNVTKTALTGLAKALAIEWGPEIRVVAIAPGFIDTPGNDNWFNSFPNPKAERQKTINMHPAGKIGTPEEIGAWCAFLASDYASFATGTTYLIDGGRSAIMQDE